MYNTDKIMEKRMKNTNELPEGYKEFYKIDLQNDKKTNVFIQVAGVLIMLLMGTIGSIFIPLTKFLDYHDGLKYGFIKLAIIAVGALLCILISLLLQSIFIGWFIKTKIQYGYTGTYAYAKGDAYFNKKSYTIISLAPMIIIGIVLLIFNFIVGTAYFWWVYFFHIVNIAAPFDRMYVVYKLSKFPKDILIKDDGASMTVYSRSK